MKKILIDIIEFLKTLNFVDFILYFAILILLILIVSLIYLLKTTSIEEELEPEDLDEELDLKATIKKLETEKPATVDLTEYEKEQEEKAIISYEELVGSIKKSSDNIELPNLKKETQSNPSKQISLDDLINEENENNNCNIKIINYEHEEAFLKALKQLNEILN